jgi:hypothetical protein
MITRATISLCLVWLCMPQNLDPGLPDTTAEACHATALCAQTANLERDAILKRLREIRVEILDGKNTQAESVFGEVVRGKRGAAESGSPFIIRS